jgi:hypothetical protein
MWTIIYGLETRGTQIDVFVHIGPVLPLLFPDKLMFCTYRSSLTLIPGQIDAFAHIGLLTLTIYI